MRTDIVTTQMRKDYKGQDVLDVIFSDGTKKKIVPVQLQQKRAYLASKIITRQAEIDAIDEEIAFFNSKQA